jgi:hypothetical protein
MPVILNPWSYSYIRKLADKAAYEAEHQGLYPTPAKKATMNYRTSRRFNIPFLGDYIPAGWERTGEIGFVDTTGGAEQGDQAMPAFEFNRRIEKMLKDERNGDIGFGVIEIGQTQALVAVYRQTLTPLSEVEPPKKGGTWQPPRNLT